MIKIESFEEGLKRAISRAKEIREWNKKFAVVAIYTFDNLCDGLKQMHELYKRTKIVNWDALLKFEEAISFYEAGVKAHDEKIKAQMLDMAEDL